MVETQRILNSWNGGEGLHTSLMPAFWRLSQEDRALEASLGYTQDHLRKQNSNSPKWPANNVYEYHLDSYTNSYYFFILILGMFSGVFLDHIKI